MRPSFLTNGPAKGSECVRALTDLKGVVGKSISRTDVAAWCLREVVDSRYRGQTPLITY